MGRRDGSTLELRLNEKSVKFPGVARRHGHAAAAEKIKALQEGELDSLLEKYRQVLDPRDPELRKRIAEQVAALDPDHEQEVMEWIEAVSIFNDEEWTGQTTE